MKIIKTRQWHEKWFRWLRYMKIKFLRINDSPDKIAKGAAVGVFLGIFPTFGLGIILAWVISAILGWNKAASVVGSFIMNPLTIPFFWTLSIIVGATVFNQDSRLILDEMKAGEVSANGGILSNLKASALIYLAGNALVSAFFSGITYFLVKKVVIKHRRKRHEAKLRRQR